MQTNFTLVQLSRPDVQEMEAILRKCVHCGFCLSACPTYSILGDERDSPRGRIYLIKELIESDGATVGSVAPHIDKCLSCLACTSVCPSGVDYQHYFDYARNQIEGRFQRSVGQKLLRTVLSKVVPNPRLFRMSLLFAKYAKLLSGLAGRTFAPVLKMAPGCLPANQILTGRTVYPAEGEKRRRVALLAGCAQQVLRPSINQASIRVLTKLGCEVVVVEAETCCGALVHHLGQEQSSRDYAKKLVAAWENEREKDGLDAIVVNASGCGTHVKDYGHIFQHDGDWREPAQRISSLAKDISEVIEEVGLPEISTGRDVRVAYHPPCSLLHGQKIDGTPESLLGLAGFALVPIAAKHFCCGSAGIYNLVQPDIADQLKSQRQTAIEALSVDYVATGNIGCQQQLQSGLTKPVVHMVELLDWAMGGSEPASHER